MEFKGIDENIGLGNKVSLVTGATTGIGKAIAILFASKGSDLVLVDRDPKIKEVSEEISKSNPDAGILPLVYDITVPDSIESIVEKSIEKFKKIDILVNNAGIARLDKAEDMTKDYWDDTMAVNLTAPFVLSQAVGREMIKKKYGKIINMSSQAGSVAIDKHIAYCVSKAGIISMTKTLALEWSKYNININSISPTVVLTEMGKKAWAGEVGEAMKKKIPVGRFAYPEEIAFLALFLASDNSSMISGENVVIDGGYTIK